MACIDCGATPCQAPHAQRGACVCECHDQDFAAKRHAADARDAARWRAIAPLVDAAESARATLAQIDPGNIGGNNAEATEWWCAYDAAGESVKALADAAIQAKGGA